MSILPTLSRLAALLPLAALAACAAQTPNLDRQFGYAVNSARLQQTIAPVAPRGLQLTVLDGAAAKAGYDNYLKSFQDPKPQPTALSISVGR